MPKVYGLRPRRISRREGHRRGIGKKSRGSPFRWIAMRLWITSQSPLLIYLGAGISRGCAARPEREAEHCAAVTAYAPLGSQRTTSHAKWAGLPQVAAYVCTIIVAVLSIATGHPKCGSRRSLRRGFCLSARACRATGVTDLRSFALAVLVPLFTAFVLLGAGFWTARRAETVGFRLSDVTEC
jgi:hypothetical protein